MNKTKTIIICCPGDSFSGSFLRNLSYLVRHISSKGFKIYFSAVYSRNIYEVRNKCLLGNPVKGEDQLPFNDINYDYILWIDNDMVFTPADFDSLYDADKNVISGLYVMANDREYAAVEDWDEDYFSENGTFEFIEKGSLRNRYLPFKVEYVGFGFILFKQGVFEKLKYPWFEPTYLQIKESRDFSMEDVTLCLKLKQNNINVYVHPEVVLGHEKTVELKV